MGRQTRVCAFHGGACVPVDYNVAAARQRAVVAVRNLQLLNNVIVFLLYRIEHHKVWIAETMRLDA